MISAIEKRISVRTYSAVSPDEDTCRYLLNLLAETNAGPFGNRLFFRLVDTKERGVGNFSEVSTYGIIKGARYYICGKVAEGPMSLEDYGYCLEKIVLKAAGAGLSTCWLGGTFSRSSLKRILELKENELIPAITPVGYAEGGVSFVDRVIRTMAGSRKRLPEDKLFFYKYPASPLKYGDEPIYEEVLKCVRLAPSASNLQPWRIIRDRAMRAFHFYLKPRTGYDKIIRKIKLQNIDMGIAMAHFALAAGEKKLKGRWRILDPHEHIQGLQYISSWLEA